MKNKLYIALALLAAFIVTKYSSGRIFLADTPRLNPNYVTNLKTQATELAAALSPANLWKKSNLASFFPTGNGSGGVVPTLVPDYFYKAISKGVAAYEKDSGTTYLKVDKGTQYKIRQIKLKDGTVLNAVDLTGN